MRRYFSAVIAITTTILSSTIPCMGFEPPKVLQPTFDELDKRTKNTPLDPRTLPMPRLPRDEGYHTNASTSPSIGADRSIYYGSYGVDAGPKARDRNGNLIYADIIYNGTKAYFSSSYSNKFGKVLSPVRAPTSYDLKAPPRQAPPRQAPPRQAPPGLSDQVVDPNIHARPAPPPRNQFNYSSGGAFIRTSARTFEDRHPQGGVFQLTIIGEDASRVVLLEPQGGIEAHIYFDRVAYFRNINGQITPQGGMQGGWVR